MKHTILKRRTVDLTLGDFLRLLGREIGLDLNPGGAEVKGYSPKGIMERLECRKADDILLRVMVLAPESVR